MNKWFYQDGSGKWHSAGIQPQGRWFCEYRMDNNGVIKKTRRKICKILSEDEVKALALKLMGIEL